MYRDSESRKSILKLVSKPKSSKAKNVKFNIGLSQDSHSSQIVLSSSSFDSESEETNNQQKKHGEGKDFVNHNIDLIDKFAEHFDEWDDEIKEECTDFNIDQEKHKDDTFTQDLKGTIKNNKKQCYEIQEICGKYSEVFDSLVYNLGFMSIKRIKSNTSKSMRDVHDIKSLNSIFEALETTQKLVEDIEKNLN